MKDKIIKILLSFDNLTKDEIEKELKAIVKEKQEETLEIERILSATAKNKLCCLPSICFKNCNDCDLKIDSNIITKL